MKRSDCAAARAVHAKDPETRDHRAMEIRPLTDTDVDTVIRVWTETKRDTYGFIELERSYTEADDAAFFRGHILPRCTIWIAVEDGAVLGFAALVGSYLDRLYVRPAAQRRGVGASLLARAIEASPDGLELHTHVENFKARAFYEKMGFVPVHFGISPPPESLPDVEYQWRP